MRVTQNFGSLYIVVNRFLTYSPAVITGYFAGFSVDTQVWIGCIRPHQASDTTIGETIFGVTNLDVNFVVGAKEQCDGVPIHGVPVGGSMHGGFENIVCRTHGQYSTCLSEDNGSTHLSNALTDRQD